MDASRITGRLWQGGIPDEGRILHRARFDVLVLCALEHQPPCSVFPGVYVVHAPNDDRGPPPTPSQVRTARQAAQVVAVALFEGRKVLVTCQKGRNRSGFVSAMALMLLGWSASQAVAKIQSRRPQALTNQHFLYELGRFELQLRESRAA